MYRWFKSSFGLVRNECQLQAHLAKPKTPLTTAAAANTSTFTAHKLAKKARKPKKPNKSSSSSSSAHSLNSTFVSHSAKQPNHHAQCVLNDEPLNDVYLNLAKFLSRQFCRNIKLRRPSKKQRQRTPPAQCAPPAFNAYNNVNNLINESKLNATSIHLTDNNNHNNNKPNNSVQYLDKFLKLEFKTNSTESLDKHTASNYFNSEKSSRQQPAFLKSLTNLNNIDRADNSLKNPIMRSKLAGGQLMANNKNKNYTSSNEATYFDEDSFDLFGITSHRSSVFDLDDISGN